MNVQIVGIGMGNPALLTEETRAAIDHAGCLIGARRLLDAFLESDAEKFAANTPAEMACAVRKWDKMGAVVVLVSGDVGFYSAARTLDTLLEGYETVYLCGISSLQYFCAKLHTAWDDVRVVSLHGREGDLPDAVSRFPKVFVLTGGSRGAGILCALLTEMGLGEASVAVGERLSYPDEQITVGTARELAGREFEALCVLLVQNPAACPAPVTHGLPDAAFLRGDIPMTKEEIRAVSVAKLRLERGMTVWDVGAGTGSVSVEIARVLEGGAVYAVEQKEDAQELISRNRTRFGLSNLHLVEGIAPAVLEQLPKPDAVFIGGSSGNLREIIEIILGKNPDARLVLNAVTLETVGAALMCVKHFNLSGVELVQLSIARAKAVGLSTMMIGQNPIWILSAGGR